MVHPLTETSIKIERAIISVSDKSGLLELAQALHRRQVQIYSTGGTAKFLTGHGIPVVEISQYTEFPEMMDGRVKTLHPKIFGGILGRPHLQADQASMQASGMVSFQLVVVNLYPFQQTISKPQVTREEAIENIDIGGPSLIRAAAKNHASVAVLTDPQQYAEAIAALDQSGDFSFAQRCRWMGAAYEHTACYDRAIANYFANSKPCDRSEQMPSQGETAPPATDSALNNDQEFPEQLTVTYRRKQRLRHGENPHQQAALYVAAHVTPPSVATSEQLNGKELSYNNLLDLDAALAIVAGLKDPACCVIKHNNPCGAAVANELVSAVKAAFAGDPVSAFGSVIGMNRTVDQATADYLVQDRSLFVEAIIAPGFEPAALESIKTKAKWKANVRLVATGAFAAGHSAVELRSVAGGALLQTTDSSISDPSVWKTVTNAAVPEQLMPDLIFAWQLVRSVKSNAITIAKLQSLIGVGAGQMSRVDSVRIAIEKAGDRVVGAVVASDAFFPFPDSIELLSQAGIAAVIQPGGSTRDQEVIDAANRLGIPMIFTGRRHFKH
jgi:phosphoribosylaminoimidazolecarboxamide formyltransferase/IMP cyclohydrolase